MEIRISDITDQAYALQLKRVELANKINSLPQNENVKKVDNNCIVMKFSIASNHHECLPSYHDFTSQYNAVADVILKRDPLKVSNTLYSSFSCGRLFRQGAPDLHLHPIAIENMRNVLWGTKREIKDEEIVL